jgi:hypothetical protein
MDKNISKIMIEEPILYLDFDEDDLSGGMDALSFVDKPATDVKWEVFQRVDDSYNDYPQAASDNACRAVKYRDKVGETGCGTRVGWTRASQLCNRRNISVETIARMASFKRHQQHKDVPYDKGCGGLMWDAWGGDEGVNWAIRKMQFINNSLRMLPFSKFEFKELDDEKRMVTAPVMLAETPILRFNADLGKYYVKFSKDTIEKMMRKYFKENKIHKVNTNHNSGEFRDGIYMVESYIVGERNTSNLFPDLPEGSWMATFYVENDEIWEKVKKQEYNGFSLEGYFIEKYEDDMIIKIVDDIQKIVDSDDIDTIKEDKIKKLLNLK